MFDKKASLEISIQAIVIVVLAMTLLGLGLGFIRGMFKNLSGTTEDVSEQIREQILTDLRTGDKKISFPKTEITIPKGESTVLNLGMRNKENSYLDYHLQFDLISCPDQTNPNLISNDCFDIDTENWFQIATPTSGYWTLDNAESHIRSVRASVPKGVYSGSYAFVFTVVIDSIGGASPELGQEVYDQKDFFIVVTG